MKISSKNSSSQLLAGLFTVVVAILSASTAQAQILLTIDDSTPDAVVITATGTGASTTVPGYPIINGFDLLGFFSPPASFTNFTVASSDLTVGNGSNALAFNKADVDNFGNVDADLGIYFKDSTSNDSSTISFTSGTAAFSGSLTVDLSAFTLQSVGANGTIQTGYNGTNGGPNTSIGEWEIVTPVSAPEPATWTLLLLSLALVPVLRRFRRA